MPKLHTEETKAEVARLRREERLSCVEIKARMLPTQISFEAICRWLKSDPLTQEESSRRRAKSWAKVRKNRALAGEIVGGEEWTALEDKVLARLWWISPWSTILEALPRRSRGAIGKRAADKGLRRSSDARTRKQARDPVFHALREIRESRRITRDELADTIGMHPVFLTRCETGDCRPSWLMLRAWLDALECELEVIEK